MHTLIQQARTLKIERNKKPNASMTEPVFKAARLREKPGIFEHWSGVNRDWVLVAFLIYAKPLNKSKGVLPALFGELLA